jgi:nicotinamidase-related amidase
MVKYENYLTTKGTPGMNTALLLLEFQNDYFPNGRISLEKSLEASSKAETVLLATREQKIPIIHVQHISTHPDATYLLPCTKGAEFYAALSPHKNETIIKKHYPNSFKDTGLLNHLIKNQINHLVICGMMTHMAIDATVRAAYDLGFSCTVLSDACAARQLEFHHNVISAQNVHYAFLAALQPTYAIVMSSEDFLQKSGARIQAVA